jgi:hypothetical protein
LVAVIDSCLLTSESLQDACDATGVFQIFESGMNESTGCQRTSDIPELGCPMELSTEIGTGGAMSQVDLDLRDSQTGSQRVDGHTYFHSPASSQWAREFERAPRQAALT